MSLEKALEENTKALNANTEALLQFAASGNGSAAPSAPAKTEKKEEKAPAKEAKKEAPKEEKKPAKTEEKNDAIPYDDVKNKTLDLVKAKGRDAVLSLLEDFGKDVKSAKDLKEDQYADYLKRVDALLEEGDDVA